MRLFKLFLSPRGEIGRAAFWFVTLAATAAALAGIIYVEEHFTGRDRDRDIIHLSIATAYLWILLAAIVKRVRHLGLTIGDLLLFLMGAVWVAGTVGLLMEITEAMKVFHDMNYTPSPTKVMQIVRWAVLGWIGLFVFMLAFVSGESSHDAAAIRTYARRRRLYIFLFAVSVLALLLLIRYLQTK